MNIYKKNTLVLFIILIMIVVVGVGSYALLLWSSPNNTELTLKIGELAGVYFDTGNNINVSNLGPIFDYNKDGEETYFTITNYITTDLLVSANLKVNSISDNLKEESFKWIVFSSEDKVNFTKVNEGDFSSVSSGDSINLLPNETILKGSSKKYKLVIYIDGNVENPISMQDGSLSGIIKVSANEPADLFVTNLASGFPTAGTYEVDTITNCSNATATFDYTTKKLLVSNVSVASGATCSPIITQITRPTLASKIKSLIPSGQTTVASTSFNDGSTLEIINSALDTGAVSNDYRYRGVNPNNYIRFNNELWRIIGVFDQYSHGQTGQELVKIIRDDSIGGYVWDNASPYNNWADSDMINLLNTGYYNSANGTGEAYCCGYSNSLPGKCDFTSKGIKEPYKSMIQNATWYLGGFNSTSVYSADMYKYERYSDTTNKTYYLRGNAVSVTDKPIGLMYVSDYGYAAPSTCTSTMDSYDTSGCADKDWLKSNDDEWTITPLNSSAVWVVILDSSGALYNFGDADLSYVTRPVLYLKSNVYYISGDGSQINPYIINM